LDQLPSLVIRLSAGLTVLVALATVVGFLLSLRHYLDLRQTSSFILRQRTRRRMRSSVTAAVFFGLLTAGALYARRTWPLPQPAEPSPLAGEPATEDQQPTLAPFASLAPGATEGVASAVPTRHATATIPFIPTNTPTLTPSATPTPSTTPTPSQTPSVTPTPTKTHTPSPTVPILEAIYTPVVPYSTPGPTAYIGELTVSRGVNLDGTPIDADTSFPVGRAVLFCSFNYVNMTNGVVWRHVWLRDGQLVGGGTRVWEWGARGRTYFFLRPLGGFLAGEYELQILVAEKVVQFTRFSVVEP